MGAQTERRLTPRDADCEYWNRAAHWFDAAAQFVVGAETQLVLKAWLYEQIDPNCSILELGCGTGQFSEVLARGGGPLVACDVSQAMLDIARTRLKPFRNVTLREEDCHSVRMPAEIFDVVFMGNLLHVVREPAAVLAEARRLLRCDGKLVTVDSTLSGMPWWARLEMGIRYLLAFGPPSQTNRVLSPREVAVMVHGAGFRVVDLALIGRETCAICLTARKQPIRLERSAGGVDAPRPQLLTRMEDR